ncbi:MAG: type II toxin-antitoxin system RelE/ParE family toxin [Candidatus Nitronauta litoralis]|uniref:Toxin n=1 Tax=Candidatus Nitronauta litoralis TaxID=2705533 RepID=A0A7T0FZL2_9BACT|nr:MAG: type II toxin-antitoxin system RelE/ParE family toxin [Candidatus Nitronauta litoralis]
MKSGPDPDNILLLSLEAEDDIRDILQYTLETYGEQQLLVYQEKLDQALATVLNNPGVGHKRPDLPPEYDAYPEGEHILIFRVKEKTIYVVRVLHGRMDFHRVFKSNIE